MKDKFIMPMRQISALVVHVGLGRYHRKSMCSDIIDYD
jgi:hypothetical protein